MLKDSAGGLLIGMGRTSREQRRHQSGEQLAASSWNLATLPTLPGSLLSAYGTIPGVTVPMMYMGMLFSTFAWHVEDTACSGQLPPHRRAEVWYGVPASAADDFEHVCARRYTDLNRQAGRLSWRDVEDELNEIHGSDHVLPRLLVEAGDRTTVPCSSPASTCYLPRGYHGGFSTGFNCGGAVNFAMADWLGLGMDSVRRYRKMQRLPLFPHEEVVVQGDQVDQVWQAEDRAQAQGGQTRMRKTQMMAAVRMRLHAAPAPAHGRKCGRTARGEVPPKVAYSHDEAVHVATRGHTPQFKRTPRGRGC